MSAIVNDKLEAAALLLDRGAAIDKEDSKHGYTALMLAIG